ncbi:MAG: hypothetical protein GYA36_13355 [Veillonellaceae bacterium]|nr:hypothetical protein [Veillonellaceae bacterium]
MCPGYEIRIPHFYCLEYREQDHTMLLEIDFRDSVIYLDDSLAMVWEAPFTQEKIESAVRRRILDRVYDYLVRQRGFKNVEYEEGDGR